MITVEKYKKDLLFEWDEFIKNSNNGTLFQTQKFLSYHLQRKFVDYSLIIKKNHQIIAVCPAALIIKGKHKILYSHPGASYGGLVIHKNINFETLHQTILAIDDFCKANLINTIVFINSPQIYYQQPDYSLEYLLKWNGFLEEELYISHAVGFIQHKPIKELLSKRKKRYINNDVTLKSVSFHSTKSLNQFFDILVMSKARYQLKPTHTLQELIALKKLFPKQIKIVVSKLKNRIIGGFILFITNKNTSLVFYNATLAEFRQTQLSSLQLYHSIKISKSLNLSYVDFGVSHTPEQDNPLAPKFSLIKFKEQFHAKAVIRNILKKNYNV